MVLLTNAWSLTPRSCKSLLCCHFSVLRTPGFKVISRLWPWKALQVFEGIFSAVMLKWDLVQLLYQKSIWLILVELWTCSPGGCHYFPESPVQRLYHLWEWFCPFLQTFFSLANAAPFFVGHTLLLLELHRCVFFCHPKILSRWKKQNLTLSLGIFGCLAAPST